MSEFIDLTTEGNPQQELHNFLANEFGYIAVESEMNDLIEIVKKLPEFRQLETRCKELEERDKEYRGLCLAIARKYDLAVVPSLSKFIQNAWDNGQKILTQRAQQD